MRHGRSAAKAPERRPLADVDCLGVDGRTGITDGAETRVRRPAAGREDRNEFVSGKTKQNAVKT
ncbi:hypothetical protein GCM10017687_69800 [Streptomyces echinatus]